MKRVLMTDTVKIICKTQEDFNKILAMGYKVKKTEKGIDYLVKKEE